ncbi:MAG TPA: NADP-dependent oxidoreductase [Thermoleophilaceae bacterium]|nr:NADP-dependent oxidoreductase [Thermoleophilaceae bacterium]
MSETTREIRLAARPEGRPTDENFELAEVPLPEPGEGQALVRNAYLSVDPYMRGRMRDAKSYVPPFEVGKVMEGGAVGEVVASNTPELSEGDWVNSQLGWREHSVVDGKSALKVDPDVAPVSTALGVLGMPGFTAWLGLTEFGRPQEGETLFVSGAAGAVGSMVGQLGALRGLRVVGSAGSDEKVELLTGELGFDAALNYKTQDLRATLRELCPDGIDIYFDNVGGEHLEAALDRMNVWGRIPLCGAISGYNEETPPPGPRNFLAVLPKRLTIRGFIILDHFDRYRDFYTEVGPLVAEGKISYRETVVEGLENMPDAFLGLLDGQNTGKMLVKL